jgi:hypothetical protein
MAGIAGKVNASPAVGNVIAHDVAERIGDGAKGAAAPAVEGIGGRHRHAAHAGAFAFAHLLHPLEAVPAQHGIGQQAHAAVLDQNGGVADIGDAVALGGYLPNIHQYLILGGEYGLRPMSRIMRMTI